MPNKSKLGENGRWGFVNVEEREGRTSVKLERKLGLQWRKRERERIVSVIENEANRRLHLYQRIRERGKLHKMYLKSSILFVFH